MVTHFPTRRMNCGRPVIAANGFAKNLLDTHRKVSACHDPRRRLFNRFSDEERIPANHPDVRLAIFGGAQPCDIGNNDQIVATA
jgi:hypothetical protein